MGNNLLFQKICLVTGASRGIGKCIAKLMAEENAIVYATSRSEHRLNWIEEEKYSNIYPVCLDVTNSDNVMRLIRKIKSESGGLDILVNNAGIEYNELIGMISKAHVQEMFATNVYGMIDMIQTSQKIMRKRVGGSCIINISSLVGEKGNKGQLAYSATKGAVIAITKSAAKELAAYNIRVNAISPGLTNTDMLHAVDFEKIQSRVDNICLGRLAEPEDIAKACIFLASDYASYISGQILAVDGCTIM